MDDVGGCTPERTQRREARWQQQQQQQQGVLSRCRGLSNRKAVLVGEGVGTARTERDAHTHPQRRREATLMVERRSSNRFSSLFTRHAVAIGSPGRNNNSNSNNWYCRAGPSLCIAPLDEHARLASSREKTNGESKALEIDVGSPWRNSNSNNSCHSRLPLCIARQQEPATLASPREKANGQQQA